MAGGAFDDDVDEAILLAFCVEIANQFGDGSRNQRDRHVVAVGKDTPAHHIRFDVLDVPMRDDFPQDRDVVHKASVGELQDVEAIRRTVLSLDSGDLGLVNSATRCPMGRWLPLRRCPVG